MILEIFHVQLIRDSGRQRLGKGRGQEGGRCGYNRATEGSSADGMFCILTVVVGTQTYTCDKIT